MQSNKSPSTQTVTQLEKCIPDFMEKESVPGLSVALINEGTALWSRGFGLADVEKKVPVTSETFFEAASLSKPVFAYATLKLWQQGAVDLDTPLITYLPPAQQTQPRLFDHIANEPRLHQITARHVLSHTPGFPNWAPSGEPLQIHIPPGKRFSYSGEGYMYLQKVVEHLTGQPALAFIEENILEPFGMLESRFTWRHDFNLPVAQGYEKDGKAAGKKEWPQMMAAATLHCTAVDFARFMGAVLRPSAANPFHLHPGTIREMLTPQVYVNDGASWQDDWPAGDVTLESQVAWGLGWGLQMAENGRTFWHWGDNGTFRAFAFGFPEAGSGIVLMSNSANGDLLWRAILQEAFGDVCPALDWLDKMYGRAAQSQTSSE